MKRLLSRMLVFSALLLLVACSTGKPLSEPKPYFSAPVTIDDSNKSEMSWWAYRYQINWPEDVEKPDFSVDLMIAHQLIKPVLEEYSSEIKWWRFHRRAARKSPGHQFSFLFYSDRQLARKIISELDNSAGLQAMKAGGLINSTVSSSTEKATKSAIEAYSDPSWSPEIQRTWPNFIMGVSAFWLALIDDIKSSQGGWNDDATIKTQLDQYRKVDIKIAELWEQEGQHALLHHLSAVFGYKRMEVRW